MGNKKRILAWILSLAMVFGVFGGQVSAATTAPDKVSLSKAEVSIKELSSEGGTVKVTLTFDDASLSTDEGIVYYRLIKDGNTVEGKENVEKFVSRTNNTFDIEVPANTGNDVEKYNIWISPTKFTDYQIIHNGAKASFSVAAPGSENPDQPENTKVLPDKTHFRARAVDKDGKPVANVEFNVKGEYGSSSTVTSDENGVIECEVGHDYGMTKTVFLAENDTWVCDTKHSFYISYSVAEIEQIDNEDLSNIREELQFILKANINKKALKSAIDKASVIKNADDYSAGYEELQTALAEANKVYLNEDASQEEVDAVVAKLNAALDAVEVKAVDKTKLKKLIADAEEKYLDRYSYVTSTWNAVSTALTEAKTINENDKVGQTVVDETAEKLDEALKGLKWNPAVNSLVRISDENVSSKGGEVQVKIVGKALENKNFSVQVKAGNAVLSEEKYAVSYGEGSTERIMTVTLPENTTSEEITYTIGVRLEYSFGGYKSTTFKVAAGKEAETPSVPSATKCDEKNFRAKVVDENGNAVEGVNVNLTGRKDTNISYDVKSDKDGMVTYTLSNSDFLLTFEAIVEDQNYTSENAHEFETDGTMTKAPKIISVNGKDLADAEELVFVVSKKSSPADEKVVCDSNNFRAKVVDAEENPIAGATFEVKGPHINTHEIISDENGVIKYTLNEAEDYDQTITVTLKENEEWTTSDEHKFLTNGRAEIFTINGSAPTGEELRYVLRAKVDKTALGEALEKANTLVEADYTEESWATFKTAMDEAQKTYDSDSVKQEEIDVQVTKLEAAMTNLKKAETPEPKPEPQPEPKPEPKPEPQPEVKKVGTVALKTTVYTYNGKVKKPAVVAKNDKKKVISASDYTVKYAAGRKNVGKYSVTVTFKNGYKGKYTKTFTILPKGTKMSSVKAAKKAFTAKWAKQSVQTTGYQVQYSTSKNFKKSVKTATISKNKTVSKTVKKLSAKRTYYVRVRTYKTVKVNGKSVKLYSGWSKVKSVKTK